MTNKISGAVKIKDFDDESKELYSNLKVASENKDYSKSIHLLDELINRNPGCGVLHAFLANSYWDVNDLDKAMDEFKSAILIEPRNEKISVGLFHLYFEIGSEDEAFDEMRRFVKAGGKMNRYNEILAEIK